MPQRPLPPLKALRAFEATARLLSLTKAANELCVTEPAVSQQVKQLETYLRRPLFIRRAWSLELTPAGELLLPVLSDSLDRISELTTSIRNGTVRQTLRVQMTPHLSARWVLPRLGRFIAQLPHIELATRHSYEQIDYIKPEVDIALAWDDHTWRKAKAEPLMHLGYLPMCSPKLMKKGVAPIDLLKGNTLLQERDTSLWADWLKAADLPTPEFRKTVVFDNYDVTVSAAVQAQGIAMLMYPMFTDLIERGDLVLPFGTATYVPITLYLLYPESSLARDEVRLFRDWITQEVAADERLKALER
ncbi:MAG TPA: LysR substrate-binding domain-containing protein [Terriglobales bacterium]|nr:LysR substrate-binding domain-containing protein [Terriglobales bacterium]